MTIKIQPITDPAWFDFVSKQENANIFHHPAWAGLLAECYNYQPFVLTEEDESEQVIGGIPFIDVYSKLTGHRWVSLPFSDYCTPLCSTPSVLESLIEYLIAQYSQKAIPRIEIRSFIPARLAIYHDNNYILHTIRLVDDLDAMLKTFDKTRVREPIRQAEKRGVEIRWVTSKSDVFTFYEMLVYTRRRHGSPVQPKRFFDLLWDRIIEKDMGFLLLAYKEGEPIGGTIYMHYKGVLTAKYNASAPKYWNLRANNLLYWSAIKWGCERGYQVFDWGRTDRQNEGLRDFKRGWGSEEQVLQYSILADRPPTEHSANSLRQRAMTTVIQRSPAWVCRMIGELLYGHFA